MTAAKLFRGRVWLTVLTGQEGIPCRMPDGRIVPSVIHADAVIGAEQARFIAVVPDAGNRFPRARHGEVGLDEGWALAHLVRETMNQDAGSCRPIIAVVDVPSQAYGRQEEMAGIHQACAAAVAAYAQARLAGHAVIAFLAGLAMSGAFLAHGYQANRILALDDAGVMVHAMAKESAARVTRRTVAELEALGERIPPMAYDVASFARLGLLHQLIHVDNADQPTDADVTVVRDALTAAIQDTRASGRRDLGNRLDSEQARIARGESLEVRRRMAEQWNKPRQT